jgi:hypothetical protein
MHRGSLFLGFGFSVPQVLMFVQQVSFKFWPLLVLGLRMQTPSCGINQHQWIPEVARTGAEYLYSRPPSKEDTPLQACNRNWKLEKKTPRRQTLKQMQAPLVTSSKNFHHSNLVQPGCKTFRYRNVCFCTKTPDKASKAYEHVNESHSAPSPLVPSLTLQHLEAQL